MHEIMNSCYFVAFRRKKKNGERERERECPELLRGVAVGGFGKT